MSLVNLLNVTVNGNPASFGSPYEFEITFECIEALKNDLEWKLTYVGSATSSEHDQVLDSLLVGPVPAGVNKFLFKADPPNLSKIPDTEVIGVTVILLSCSYEDREFVRVGYYVNNEYTDEALINDPPAKPIIEKVRRNILAEKPRVTRFAIKWDSEEAAPAEFPPEQPEADAAEDDEAAYGADEVDEEAEIEGELKVEGEDEAMGGTEEETAHAKAHQDEEEESDDGSEDLGSESEGDEDEEELAEGEEKRDAGDHDMEMGDDVQHHKEAGMQHQQQDVMVH